MSKYTSHITLIYKSHIFLSFVIATIYLVDIVIVLFLLSESYSIISTLTNIKLYEDFLYDHHILKTKKIHLQLNIEKRVTNPNNSLTCYL